MGAVSEAIGLAPPEGLKIVLVLCLSFLIGLEREEHKATGTYTFGGVRTFPLIGLLGYALSLVSGGQIAAPAVGFVVVGGFLLLSYHHKLASSPTSGATTEVSGLITYLLGVLVQREFYWIATTLVVLSLLLLALKEALESLSRRIAPEEILSFTKFLLLSFVILPAVPNQDFTVFRINPFKTWLVVVAVSAVSYGSYILQRLLKGEGGVLLAAALGGLYSSTVTTVTLAKRSSSEGRPDLFSGGILMASGLMYLRLAVLLSLFNRDLMRALAPSFLVLAIVAGLGGFLWARRAGGAKASAEAAPKNPLELDAAFLFALLFVGILVLTHFALAYLGKGGVYGLAAVMGLTDVDPFIMGMTQSVAVKTPLSVAAGAVAIAAASNNAVKGLYAYVFAERRAGATSLLLLLGLALLGLLPLFLL